MSLGAIGGLVSSAMGLAGSLYATREAGKQNERNIGFQREMATTAHQKEVADLKAAGLNPILSAGGSGASASGGSSMAVPSPTEGLTDDVTSAYKTLKTEKDLAKTQMDLNKQMQTQSKSTAKREEANAKLAKSQSHKANMETRAIKATLPRSETIANAWSTAKNFSEKVKTGMKKSGKQASKKVKKINPYTRSQSI